MNESEVQQKIQIAAPYEGCQLMRNNSGALKDQTGRTVRYGLGNVSKKHNDKIKSSDLIGFTEVVITPEMVGKRVAIFTAVEVKRSDWAFDYEDKREMAQLAFMLWVKQHGGFAEFCASPEFFEKLIRNFKIDLTL